jgi:eukaryotic translation initiation factor 2C
LVVVRLWSSPLTGSEIIAELEEMVFTQLSKFRENTKNLPEKILMFRDGVSEGQYSHCVKWGLFKLTDSLR